MSMGNSVTSSRKMVPLLANSNLPVRRCVAPVNAPFSCPKSSLSTKPEGMDPQLTFTKGRSWRRLRS